VHPDVGAAAELDVGEGERGEFAYAQTGLDGEYEQGVVAAAVPAGSVGRIQQGVDLVAGEVTDGPALVTLGRDGEHPLDLAGVVGMAQGGEPEQRSDRGQAGVAGSNAVVPLPLQMSQEIGDQVGVEIVEAELARWFPGSFGGESEQQPQRVPVGGDGAGAGLQLVQQPLGEERFDSGGERTHRSTSLGWSKQAAASASSSGAACRYQ